MKVQPGYEEAGYGGLQVCLFDNVCFAIMNYNAWYTANRP